MDKEEVDEEYRRLKSKVKPSLVPYYKNKVKKIFSYYGFTQIPLDLKTRMNDRFYYLGNFFKPKGTYSFVISFNDEYFYLVTKKMKPLIEVKYHRFKIPFVNRRIKLYIDEITYTPQNIVDCRYMKKKYLNQFILFNDKEKKIAKNELRVFANDFDLSESRKFGQMPLLPDKTYFLDFLDNQKRFDKVWMVPVRGAYLNRPFTFEIHMEKK